MTKNKGKKVIDGPSRSPDPEIEAMFDDVVEEGHVAQETTVTLDPRFGNLATQAEYRRLHGRLIHKERHVIIKKSAVKALLRFHSWQAYYEEPHQIHPGWVQEFYADAVVNQRKSVSSRRTYTVTVRGQDVDFGIYSIKACLGLPAQPAHCEYQALVKLNFNAVNFDDVLGVIADEGATWVNRNKLLKTKDLTVDAKFWYEFVRHCIMPTTNKSDVTKERSVLVYAILKQMKINVVQLVYEALQNQITRAVSEGPSVPQKKKTPFIFPSLITALCMKSQVRKELDENFDAPGLMIEYIDTVRQPKGTKRARPDPIGGDGSSRQPQGSVPPQSASEVALAHEMAQIRIGQSVLMANMQMLAQYQRQLMMTSDISAGRPPFNYPVVPDFLPLPTATVDEPMTDPTDNEVDAEEDGGDDLGEP